MRRATRDNVRLYEHGPRWGRLRDAGYYEKKRLFQALVPPEVRTILDVGCGDGEITNDLRPGALVVGCDRSQAALGHVRVPRVIASSDALPFCDAAFDLVLCSEVLEHLPEAVYRRTLRELARVCGQFVLISVPYREDMRLGITRCARCGAKYHLDGHMRSFHGPAVLVQEFEGFRATFVGRLGLQKKGDRRSPRWLLVLRRCLLADWPTGEFAVCPLCGSRDTARGQHSLRALKWILDRLEWRLSLPPRHHWIVLKLQRVSR